MYSCLYVIMHVCICTCEDFYFPVYTCVYMFVLLFTFTCLFVFIFMFSIFSYIHMYIYTFVCICCCICIGISSCADIYIYIDMHDMHATCMSYCVALSRFFESCFGGRWCPYDIGSNFQKLTGGTLLVECLAKPTPSRAPHRRVKREE